MGDVDEKRPNLLHHFHVATGMIEDGSIREVHLSEIKNFFEDQETVDLLLEDEDPVVYKVSSIEFMNKEGDLQYGMGTVFPGRVGSEYFMTKGHFHAWRPAAEIYIGLKGYGIMLLEEEGAENDQVVEIKENTVVHVPGYTAHRTINTGEEPLVYLGIYPANAGHDYGSIAVNNFKDVIVEKDGNPVQVKRNIYAEWIENQN